ncbi:XdhC family protein [Planctomycetota bacterium]
MSRNYQAKDIYQKVIEFIEKNHSFALAWVLQADGSTPGKISNKAVIDQTGKIWGTVGGGSVEAEAQRRAVEVCKSKIPVVFDASMDGADADDEKSLCGGAMRVLIDPVVEKYKECFSQAAEALQQRRRGVLLTKVKNTSPANVDVCWFFEDTLPLESGFPGTEAIQACFKRETPQLFVENPQQPESDLEVFVEPVIPRPLLMIAGGGHIGQALALQADLVGFDIMILDDRSEFTNPQLFPEDAKTNCDDIAMVISDFDITSDTYIVIVTRGHKHDAETLKACIHAPAGYIGMIGSKRKVALIRENFIESGIATEEQFRRVFAPIGLDIGAVTVPEIAASIVSQLIAVRRKGKDYSPPGDMVLQ